MKTRTITLLIISLVILGSIYYFDYKKIVDESAHELEIGRITSLSIDEINSLTFQNATGIYTLEKKSDGLWWLTAPIEELAESGVIRNTILPAINEIQRYSPIELLPSDRARYGLDNPGTIHVTLNGKDKKNSTSFTLGGESPLQGEGYLTDPDHPGLVYATSLKLRHAFERNLHDLRDKTVLRFPMQNVNAIEIILSAEDNDLITTASAPLSLLREDGQWRVAQGLAPLRAADWRNADAHLVESILQALTAMPAIDPFEEMSDANANQADAGDASTLAKYGLDKTPIRVNLHYQDQKTSQSKTTTIWFSSPPFRKNSADTRKYYARSEGRDLVFNAESSLIGIMQQPAAIYRDHTLFTLKSEEISYLQIEILSSVVALERDASGEWHLAADSETPVNQGRVANYLAILLAQSVETFAPSPTAQSFTDAGLDIATIRIMIANSDRSRREGIEVGHRLDDESPFFYARKIDANNIEDIFSLGLPQALFSALLRTEKYFAIKTLIPFEIDQVSRVLVEIGVENKQNLVVQKVEGSPTGWQAQFNENEARNLPEKNVSQLLETLHGLEYMFPTESVTTETLTTYGLNPPGLRLLLFNANDEVIATLGIGQAEEGARQALVLRGENELFYVNPKSFQGVSVSLSEIAVRLR